MIKSFRQLFNKSRLRILIVAGSFGLISMLTIALGVQLQLPGTSAHTDPREILNVIGSALTGPIGGAIIGFLSSLFTQPQLRWFSIFQHIISAVWIGWAYKKLLHDRYEMPYLAIGWIALLVIYFFVIRIPGLLIAHLLFPDWFLWLVGGRISFFDALAKLYSGWLPEIIFTTIYTSLLIIALPKKFRMPLWGKPVVNLGESKTIYKYPEFLNKIFKKNFIAIRLSLWFLLLFSMPLIYLSIFTGNYFMKYTLDREAADQARAAEYINRILSNSPSEKYAQILKEINTLDERRIVLVDKDFNFLPDLNSISESDWKADYQSFLQQYKHDKFVRSIVNTKQGIVVGIAESDDNNFYVLSFSPKQSYSSQLKNFFFFIQKNFGIALLIVSILSGWIIWLIIGDPIKKLTNVAVEIGKQNYDVKIDAQSMTDEVGLLATSIEKMKNDINAVHNELLRNEAKFTSLIDSMQDLVYTLDKNLNITGLYGQWSEMYGLTEELLMGKKLTAFLSPAESEINEIACAKALNGEAVKFEWHLNKSEDKFYFESSLTPLFGAKNEIIGILGVAREITNRVEYERKLKESEDRYRILTESSPEAIVVHSFGKIIYANLSALKSVGAKSIDELIGKNIFEFIHPDYRALIAERVKMAAEQNTELPVVEIKIIKPDGSIMDVEVSGVPIIYDGKRVLQTIVHDITTRKKSETELKKLSKAVNYSPAGILITDRNGTIEYVNPKFTETTKYAFEDVVGNNPRILKSGMQDEAFYKNLWDTILRGELWRGELQNKRRSGEIYWERDLISSIKNSAGEITHFIAIKEDIDDRKKIEQELILAKDRAEDADKLKSSLLANISHEFRTPLNGILGFSQLLKEEITQPDHANMLDKIMKSGKRLMETLNSVLTLTELENKKYLIIPSALDVPMVCGQIKTQFDAYAREKELNFELESPEEEFIIHSDENLLTRIITSCVDNALKYTFSGGVKIKVGMKNDSRGTKYAVVDIIDSGIGIEKSNQEIIFKEFKQLSEGYRRDYEGLGLGLSISYKMIKLLHGDIQLQSEYGKGSTFSIIIPAEFENAGIAQGGKTGPVIATAGIRKSSEEKLKILLIEDNLLNIEVIQRFLVGKFLVESVTDGEKALKIAVQKSFDLFLIDINLGRGIDGIEVLRQLRHLEKYKEVQAVALTGYASSSNMNEFLSQGFNGYIAKPFDKKSLLEVIDKLFIQK